MRIFPNSNKGTGADRSFFTYLGVGGKCARGSHARKEDEKKRRHTPSLP